MPFDLAPNARAELARRPALLSDLQVLAPDPPTTVLRLLASHRANDARREPALRRREVVVAAAHHRNPHTAALDYVDERLQLPRGAVEAVVMPGHDGVEAAFVDRREHPVRRPGRRLPV